MDLDFNLVLQIILGLLALGGAGGGAWAGRKSGHKAGRQAVSEMDRAQNLRIKGLEECNKKLEVDHVAFRREQADIRKRMEMLEYKFGLDP